MFLLLFSEALEEPSSKFHVSFDDFLLQKITRTYVSWRQCCFLHRNSYSRNFTVIDVEGLCVQVGQFTVTRCSYQVT